MIFEEIINGEKIYLKTLAPENATQEYCNWLNDPEVNVYLETRKSTIEEVKEYIRKQMEDPNSFFVGIFLKESNKHIGNIKLEPIDWQARRALIGIIIGDKAEWGKGYATDAIKVMIQFAFKTLGLIEIELGVISENAAAIRTYEKVGFVVDHVEKKAKKHGQKYFDMVVMKMYNSGLN